MVKPGFLFTHKRMLDTSRKPGPGQKYADAPKVRCIVTRVTTTTVFFMYLGGDGKADGGRMWVNRDEFEKDYC